MIMEVAVLAGDELRTAPRLLGRTLSLSISLWQWHWPLPERERVCLFVCVLPSSVDAGQYRAHLGRNAVDDEAASTVRHVAIGRSSFHVKTDSGPTVCRRHME